MDPKEQKELDQFLADWQETPERNKEIFLRLQQGLAAREGVKLNFIPRPGLTYSLRAAHENQTEKPLFAMVDVIEDQPRWLSVCFYGEYITDPEELGDYVPEGLLGEDAVCFDLEEWDEKLIGYVEDRIAEAGQKAAAG